jgi:3-hydroxyacyl-CoA dehydrogenase
MNDNIAIIGSGSIGVAFAVLFAGAGAQVHLWDLAPEALARAEQDVRIRAAELDEFGLLSGTPEALRGRIHYHTDLAAAVQGAALIQECIPEKLDLKRDLFTRLAALAPLDAVFASSSSAIPPSPMAEGNPAADRIIVGHPGNPPYLLPVIEIVPTPQTSPESLAAAERIYRDAGLQPVLVRKEVEGFVFNRLQGALLREAYCLVRDGVASVADIDAVVRSGLGPRWSVIGPFETVDLNTRGGIASHAEKMGPAYARMGAERGQNDPWTPELVAKVAAERREILPLEAWEARVMWRDRQLMALRRLATQR